MLSKMKIILLFKILVLIKLIKKRSKKELESHKEFYESIRNPLLQNVLRVCFLAIAFGCLFLPTFLIVLSIGILLVNIPLSQHFFVSLKENDQIMLVLGLSTIPTIWLTKKVYRQIISLYSKINLSLTIFTIRFLKILINYGTLYFAIRAILYDATYNDLTFTFVFGILSIFLSSEISEKRLILKHD